MSLKWSHIKFKLGSTGEKMNRRTKTNTKNFSLRIENDLLRKFEYIASSQDRSINSMLNSMIRKTVRAYEEQNGEIPIDVSEQ